MLEDISSWDVLVGRVKGRWDKASLRITPYSEAKGRFGEGAKLCAQVGKERLLLEVKASRPKDGVWICDCGLASSEMADRLIGAELFIDRSMREKPEDGGFYVDELFGMRVVSESGVEMGEITEVLETPNNDVYVTPKAMIPAHPDFIVSRDMEARVIVVRDIPGLLTEE